MYYACNKYITVLFSVRGSMEFMFELSVFLDIPHTTCPTYQE